MVEPRSDIVRMLVPFYQIPGGTINVDALIQSAKKLEEFYKEGETTNDGTV